MSELTDIDGNLETLVPRVAQLRAARSSVLDQANDIKAEIGELRQQLAHPGKGGPTPDQAAELENHIGQVQGKLEDLTGEAY